MKLWKYEMELRKYEIKVPKNLFVPRWRIRGAAMENADLPGRALNGGGRLKKKGEDTVAWYPLHRNRIRYVRLEAVAHRDSGVDVGFVIALASHKVASCT